jgi:hypothetical protein
LLYEGFIWFWTPKRPTLGGVARVDPGRFRRGFFARAARHHCRRAPCGARYSLRPPVTPFTIAENRKIRPGGPKGDWARPRADVRGGGLARVHRRPIRLWRPSGASARPACGGSSPSRRLLSLKITPLARSSGLAEACS